MKEQTIIFGIIVVSSMMVMWSIFSIMQDDSLEEDNDKADRE